MNRRALVTILVGLALLMIGATIRSGWLYLVASLLFAVVIVSLAVGFAATRPVEIAREAPKQVFERRPFEVRLRVSNPGRFKRRLLTVRDLQFPGGAGGGVVARARARRAEFQEYLRTGKPPAPGERGRAGKPARVVIEALPGHSGIDVSYEMEAPRRGIYPPARMEVSSGGLFGSAEFTRRHSMGSTLTVFPAIQRIDSFRFDPRASLSPVELVEWSRKGIGQDYYGIREYTRGDSLRHVHWPSSARQGKLIVKEYEQELRPSVAMVLAFGAPGFGTPDDNSLEDGLRAAASIVSRLESMGGLPLMVTPRREGFAAEERETFYGCLAALAEYDATAGHTVSPRRFLELGIDQAMESMPPGSSLVLLTNRRPEDVAEALSSYRSLPGGSLVLVIDEAYGRQWKDEWLEDAPWLAVFPGGEMDLYAVTPERGIGRCLSEPLNTTS